MEGLSVVMPTLGRRATLPRALARLHGQEGLGEVLLGADAAADHGAVQRAWSAAGLTGRVVRGTVPGASAARNAGWRAARGAVVLFLDDDVLAQPGLVAAHSREHAGDPADDLAVLGGVRWADGLRVSAFMRWVEGLQFDFAAMQPGALTGWWHFYTANASVKRAALEQVDGFDAEGLPFGYEDLDIAKRAALRVRYVPGAAAQHDHAMTLEQWRGRIERLAWSERRFVARHPEVAPFFHDRFAAAALTPRARGRAARVVDLVPQRVPWLGALVHDVARLYWEQELAERFLAAWRRAGAGAPGPPPAPR